MQQPHSACFPVIVCPISKKKNCPLHLFGISSVPIYVHHLSTYCLHQEEESGSSTSIYSDEVFTDRNKGSPSPTHFISRPDKLSLFNLSSSITLGIFHIFCWTCSIVQWFSCIGEHQTGHSTPGLVPQVLHWGRRSLPQPAGSCFPNTAHHVSFAARAQPWLILSSTGAVMSPDLLQNCFRHKHTLDSNVE